MPFKPILLLSISKLEEGKDEYLSCRPNCAYNFDPASFSFELRASKTINRREEVVYSYCDPGAPTEKRQSVLQSYGFSCDSISCVPTTPEYLSSDAIRTTILPRIKWLSDENQQVPKDPNAKDIGDSEESIP
ncbi:hypothetical protein BDQ17DRAFT_1414902 [Cyathus striatus]|nr:hypothetical protein BDQ17DRAFT_1414902 [Cyathus striatus]